MEEGGEINDWEMLHHTDPGTITAPNSTLNSSDLGAVEGDTEDVVRADYFTLDSPEKSDIILEENNPDSENASWIEPASGSQLGNFGRRIADLGGAEFPTKHSTEFWSDSSDGSTGLEFTDSRRDVESAFEVGIKTEAVSADPGLSPVEGTSSGLLFVSNEGTSSHWGVRNFHETNLLAPETSATRDGCFGKVQHERDNLQEFLSDLGNEGDEAEGELSEISRIEHLQESPEHPEQGNILAEDPESVTMDEVKSLVGKSNQKRRLVWWKIPCEILRFVVFRIGPAWSLSIAAAAAIFGVVILRRRLSKMKQKPHSADIRASMDDKKVSQFMSHVARLNEAFSVVRHASVMRTSFPAAGGVSLWPVMGLR